METTLNKFLIPIAVGCLCASLAGCAPIDSSAGAYTAMDENFAKATNFNLAQCVHNAKRLDDPAEIGPANSQAAVGPVDRYQRGSVRDIENDLGGASSGVGGSGK